MSQQILTAELEHLAFLNFVVPPELLNPYLPYGTELDFYNGKTYLSLVGMKFLNTKVFDFPVPFAQNFVEVNLRFYVKRETTEGIRRGIVFIKEIVSNIAVAAAGRWIFQEKYISLPMEHSVNFDPAGESRFVEYGWRTEKELNFMRVILEGEMRSYANGSLEEFLIQRNWGYTALPDKLTHEFKFDHPEWRYWQGKEAVLNCNIAELYGREFVSYLTLIPNITFVANGSSATMYKGEKL